jgi:nitroimidazol reductase NimA-like FMN-containing flavoprotein (pyridoxamine 5'-phosphate oxidase superfamily)
MSHDLVDLETAECWELVSQQPTCRIAWTSGDGPTIIPVNHVVFDEALWIRTSAYSSLVQEVDDTKVAILVDRFDPETRLGWSVQLRGIAQVLFHHDEVPEEVRHLTTWAPGAKPLWVQLRPDEVIGRRLVAGD